MASPLEYLSEPPAGDDAAATPSGSPLQYLTGPGTQQQSTPPPSILNSSWSDVGKQLWDEGARRAAMGTGEALSGLSGIVTAPADVITWPGRAFNRAVWGENMPGAPQGWNEAPSTTAERALSIFPPPQTPTEQREGALISGGASALPTILSGGAASPATPIRQLLTSGIGGLSAEEIANSPWVPESLKPTAAAIAGILGTKVADVPFSLGSKFTGSPNAIYEAFKRQQIDPAGVGTVSGSPTAQSVEAAASRTPFASEVMIPKQRTMLDQFGNAVERNAAILDPSNTATTLQTTGERIQTLARNWKDNTFPTQEAAVWQPINARLSGTAVDPTNYRSALDNATNFLNLPKTQQALTPGLAKTLADAIATDVPPGSAMQWDQAAALRSRIGKLMGVPEIQQSVGMDALKKSYAALSDDMRVTANANNAGRAFDAANQFSTEGNAFLEGPLAKVISKNNPNQETIRPEQATNNLMNAGDTDIQALRARLPEAADQLAAYNLRQSATAKPSQAVGYDDTSTGSFLTSINRLRQNRPGVYSALYDNPGTPAAVQQGVGDLQTAAGALRGTEKRLNTSGTAEQLGWLGYVSKVADALLEGKPLKAGTIAAAAPTVGYGSGALLTSPSAARFAAAPATPAQLRPSIAGLLSAAPQLVSLQ